MKTTLLMYGGFHDKDKLILLSEKMQVCISQIKCNDCAVGVMHLLWWLAFRRLRQKSFISPVDFRKKSVIIISRQAGVAQLVEQLTCNQQVISPNLIAGSITLRD